MRGFMDYINKISIFLFYSLSLLMLYGSFLMKKDPLPFLLLKQKTIQDWIKIYAIKNISYTWWFILCIFLLFFIAISTTLCIMNEKNKSSFLMHTGTILLMLGILLNHTLSTIFSGNIITKKKGIDIPGTDIRISIKSIKIDFFPEDTHFLDMANKASDCSAILLIKNGKEVVKKRISINRPCFYKGFAIFIEDFAPKESSYKKEPFLELLIRKDRGIYPMLFGVSLFFIGLLGVVK